MTIQEKALNELISYRNKLNSIEYDDVKILIEESIREIPIATAMLYRNAPIDRVRLNKKTLFFTKEDDLTYIKDEEVIRNLTKFGRANRPHQPLFYGALESSLIRHNRLTAITETSKLLQDTESKCLRGELFTLSRWITNKELEVVEIVFSDEALKLNPDTQKSFKNQFEWVKDHPLRELHLRQLQLFSNEFSRKANSHHDYKISVAYSDLILNKAGFAGITYPSVQSGYQGQNIVLRTDIVDEYLALFSVSTHRLHKNKMQSLMSNYFHTQNFGRDNSNFQWNPNECNEERIISESIQRLLTGKDLESK